MKTFLSIILLTVSVSVFSQNTKIDSLQQKLTHVKGHDRILVLNDLANEYGYIDFNKSISLANEALSLAQIQKCNDTKARSYNIIGRAYYISNNFKVADEYYNKGISIAKKYKTPDDIYKALRLKTLLYANGYNVDSIESLKVFKQFINLTIEKNKFDDFTESLNIYAFIYSSQPSTLSEMIDYLTNLEEHTIDNTEFLSAIYASEGFLLKQNLEYFKAIMKFEDAIKLTKEIPKKISYLERTGMIYFEVRKPKESVKYFKDAMQLLNTCEFEKKVFMLHLLEADLGASFLQLKDYKAGLCYLQKALKSPYFSKRDKGAIYGNLGIVYLSIDSLDRADYYLSKALIISDSFKVNSDKLAFLHSKAELMKHRKQWTQRSNLITEISQLAAEVKDYYVIYDSYELLSDYYEKSGNYKKSNEYLKKWITVNDSINNRDFVNKISELRFKYETEEKEQQIFLQQGTIRQKDKLIVLSFIAGILIFAALVAIFILYRIRNKAYRRLVYQSLENTSNSELVKLINLANETDTIVVSNIIPTLYEKLKKRIEISLNKQLDEKVYLEPNLLLKTLAEKCDTNRNYLSQFINERYNTNFNTFINELRINEAKQILSDRKNDMPLKELYLRLGFNTYSVFNEAFKKHVGVTPNFYLKTVKELLEASNLQ